MYLARLSYSSEISDYKKVPMESALYTEVQTYILHYLWSNILLLVI